MNKHVPAQQLDRASASGASSASPGKSRTRIGRSFRFESAHYLPLVSDGHRCRNMHGHNYRVEIVVSGPLDDRGFVRDFAEIDAEVMPLVKELDHRVLNDIEGLENPTAEVIAAWFLERIEGCESVRVFENDDCWAEVWR